MLKVVCGAVTSRRGEGVQSVYGRPPNRMVECTMRARWTKQSRCCSRVPTRNCSRLSTSRRPLGSGERVTYLARPANKCASVQCQVFWSRKNADRVIFQRFSGTTLCLCLRLRKQTSIQYYCSVFSASSWFRGSCRCPDIVVKPRS